jgi:hypothetical protein
MYFGWLADRKPKPVRFSPAHERSTRITAVLAGGVEHCAHQCALQLADRGGSARGVGVLLALPCAIESGVFGSAASSRAAPHQAARVSQATRPGRARQTPWARSSAGSEDTATPAHPLRGAPLRRAAGRDAPIKRGHLMGFLYVDGYVRACHGQRAISSNAHVPRRHLAMPASTDYWIHDRSGDPLW